MIPDPGRVRRLLVRANNWIGDVVMASPALHALRERYSGARITVLARPQVIPALEGSADLDELLLFDHLGRHRGAFGRLALIRELRGRRFDMAVLFQKAFEAALLASAAGVPCRVGYDTDRRSWLLTDAVAETDEVRARHHARVFLDLAEAAGAEVPARPELRFPITPADRDGATGALLAAGVGTDEPVVAIHPGASKLPRAWHPERFGRLGREIARRIGGRAVVLGSLAEEPLAHRAAEACGESAVDLSGRTTVREMAAVFERARMFVGSDSGPMHVAAAVGAPVLAVFGPGAPEKTAPFVDAGRVEILSRHFPCSPCRQAFFRECDPAPSGKPYCIEEIGLAEAAEAAGRLLDRTAGRS